MTCSSDQQTCHWENPILLLAAKDHYAKYEAKGKENREKTRHMKRQLLEAMLVESAGPTTHQWAKATRGIKCTMVTAGTRTEEWGIWKEQFFSRVAGLAGKQDKQETSSSSASSAPGSGEGLRSKGNGRSPGTTWSARSQNKLRKESIQADLDAFLSPCFDEACQLTEMWNEHGSHEMWHHGKCEVAKALQSQDHQHWGAA